MTGLAVLGLLAFALAAGITPLTDRRRAWDQHVDEALAVVNGEPS